MVDINIFCRAQVGQDLGLIKHATKSTDDVNVAVNHESGEVMLIEFWASWCKFSQVPIKATNDMMAANKAKWEGKVRAVGLSIDQDKAKCEAYIKEKGLDSIEHYNVKNKQCPAIPYFGVKQIPYCALIDKEGKIAFIGHPSWRRLDEDINTLIKGKKITGRGCVSPVMQAKAQWGTEGIVEVAEVDNIVKNFMEQCNTLASKHDIESTSLAMKQCTVQLVHKVKLNLQEKSHEHKVKLDILMEGTKEQIDLMKWHFTDMADKKNKWVTKMQVKQTNA